MFLEPLRLAWLERSLAGPLLWQLVPLVAACWADPPARRLAQAQWPPRPWCLTRQ